MTRQSNISKHSDTSGDYEVEIFDCKNPERIIVGVHGNGVRRWDGEKFYYQVAEEFTDSVVVLVDQNQIEGDGCRLNSIDIMAARNQKAVEKALAEYPELPIWIVAHSMGCGITSQLDTEGLTGIIFVAPGVGTQVAKYIERYGEDILQGKVIKTSDGLTKNISKEFMDSVKDIKWQDEYQALIDRFSPVHVFESGDDEIVDEERFELREMPFTSYKVIERAKHNFTGEHSQKLFSAIKELF